ncbi:hypothetical protein LXA43DRAFT_975113 [Ganoderma leucocontextum]|nr:hypothetical protein LXA43DRAFT_975113 [Ganoderma leucocontextum]
MSYHGGLVLPPLVTPMVTSMRPGYPYIAPPSPLHPLLCGELGDKPKLLFDLSSHSCSPRHSTRGGGTHIRLDELSAPATYPPVYRMTITCDHIPQWPITIERRVSTTSAASNLPPELAIWADIPITAYDVLTAVHHALRIQVSTGNWSNLSREEQRLVMEAYIRRCRRVAGTRWLDVVGGLRRVDYLANRYMFRGLVSQSIQGGVAHVKLVVGKKTAGW